ncbi:transcriptional regulator, DeoR family [Gleimia coleocanis DSM 15436]|uniref:Transcriptional regulator, DeoR family n=1 Tax=Gleimia coleocanis DSM 15436 TaxID=525245 RepID=C0VYG8_9ACTO|nr:DeoR/GlpR family DNA-binding transcription regulator [Gleimia coleocanis]EEH64471.1 transcriptional regulator, DeoR family [Gleimia coleocanis DSM 15436]
MTRQERLSQLVDLVIERGSIRVEDAIEVLEVSAATVRRDLDALAEQQLIVRTRGGATTNASTGELPLRYRAVTQTAQKAAIACAAAELVQPGEVIGFNGGTTTTLAAYEIGVYVSADERFADNGITLVTNSINIANDLIVRPRVRVVVTGGVVRARSYELIGPLSSLILPNISVDTLFLGVNGLDYTSGLYANHEGEADVNAALVKAAKKVVVLADSTKLGTTAFARIAPLSVMSTLITDSGIPALQREKLESQGIEVILADGPKKEEN